MKKRLLIFTWEFYGYHSVRGTALSKRPRQVADSFRNNGWEVTVIHRDHLNECGNDRFRTYTEANGIQRITVKSKGTEITRRNTVARKMETLYYVAFRGDRTYDWGKHVLDNFDSFGITEKPDYIISFYMPRATLFLGDHFSRKLGIPWLADLQDPIYDGVSRKSWFLLGNWMRNVLKSAKAIVHVSPEWVAMDGQRLGMKVDMIRHAIPDPVPQPTDIGREQFLKEHGSNSLNVFYGGSISLERQSLDLLKNVIARAARSGVTIKILLAGNENARNTFRSELGTDAVIYLGWLDSEAMNRYIFNCDCTLVVPLSHQKIGIPSKFFELCSYPKPVWIAGNDLGSFKSLLHDWQHPEIKIDDAGYQEKAVLAAAGKDFSLMFNLEQCKGTYLRASELFAAYSALM